MAPRIPLISAILAAIRRMAKWLCQPLVLSALAFGLLASPFALILLFGGCRTGTNLALRNDTGSKIVVVSGHTHDSTIVSVGQTKVIPHTIGSLAVIVGTNIWTYQEIDVTLHWDIARHTPKLGFWSFYQTDVRLNEQGCLSIGQSNYMPLKVFQW